ncbi:MAG: alpha/beta hydrolase [Piscirickettsiaceae bacterium]|nr:MAG: alpha/beta hydrolase [Piscirickettsiaceae bacterium]
MPFTQLTDFNTHYHQQGNGSIPVIFIHGNFGSWRHWTPSLENLPTDFIAYAPDLRGCGDSEAPSDGYDIQTLSEDILNLANNLKLDKFHLVGHSLGGAVAQELAGTSPERILSLTLVSPSPAEGLLSLKNISTANSAFSATNIFQFFDNIGLRRKIHSLSFKKTMPGLRKNKNYLDMIITDAIKMDMKAFDGFLKTLKTWNGVKHLSHFNFPVLIMRGDLDSVIPLQPLKNMCQHIKNCRFHTFKRIGHSPQLESAHDFNRLLFAFIQGNDIIVEPSTTSPSKKSGLLKSLVIKLKSIFRKFS